MMAEKKTTAKEKSMQRKAAAQVKERLPMVEDLGQEIAPPTMGIIGCGALSRGFVTDTKLPKMTEDDLYPDVEVLPFATLIWNSNYAKEDWSGIMNRAANFHDRAEYWMVQDGHRKCATLHIRPQDYDHWIDRITQDGLVWLPIQRTRNYTGFSHKHFPVNQIDMNTSVYGVLARTIEDAEAFRTASQPNAVDHDKIGELLGFPECCRKAFNRHWPTFYDPVYQVAEESPHKAWHGELYDALYVEPHIACHQMMRYIGLRLTSHFPCSLQCEASIEVGKLWIKTGEKHDPRGLEALMKIMSLPGEWSVLNGIAVVETEPFTITSNSIPTKKRFSVRWDKVQMY